MVPRSAGEGVSGRRRSRRHRPDQRQSTDSPRFHLYTVRSLHQRKPNLSNSIAAHKHRTQLHILRDRVKRALRDEKHGVAGAAERLAAHRAKRAAYRAAHP